jgi:tRNA threonylcarbamoyl adenosine modification protein (Sua5/YciO/YrdC/YwlC family)
MILRIHPDNPGERQVQITAEILQNGGIIIFPTDTVYGLGCDIFNARAVEKVARIKGISIEKANFSFICYDLSHLSDFARHVSNPTFKLMKQCLPGPFTFILEASNKVPKVFRNKKRTIGIRIPANNIIRAVVKELGHPVLTTSIHDEDEIHDYITDPELIYEKYQKIVDAVIDGGFGNVHPSTVIDCSGEEPVLVRQGIGEVEL